MMLRLTDDENTRSVLNEQQAAALQCLCSVCEEQVAHRSELDASGRCSECAP